MNRYSTRRSDHIEYSLWLVIDYEGGARMVRGPPSVTDIVEQPSTSRGEIAVAVMIKAPLTLWRKPLLKATIDVPASIGLSGEEVVTAVAGALEAANLHVDLQLVPPDQ